MEKLTRENFQTFYDSMSDGDKIHMANKLWRDDEIVAHKALEAYGLLASKEALATNRKSAGN